MTDTQTLEKLLKEALERIHKLENKVAIQGGAISGASKSAATKWNGGYVTNPTYFEALAQINDAWEELDAAGFEQKLYRTATNEPEDHPFDARDAELRWWDANTGYYINAFPFLLTVDAESTPWLLIDQALAVRKDFYALGMLTSGEGVLNLYGGVGWGPDGFNSNPFIWLGKGGIYGSKDYLEIRRTLTGPTWGWGHLKCGDIYSNGTRIYGVADKGTSTTLADGTKTISFTASFSSAPLVLVQSNDASGRGVRIDVTARSASQFSVKATIVSSAHKHKIGAIGASGVGATYNTSTVAAHRHNQYLDVVWWETAEADGHVHQYEEAIHTDEYTTYENSHYHTVQISPYIRALDLRDENGDSELCGAVLINSNEAAVDLYTEETTTEQNVAADFSWIAIEA